MQPPTLGHRQRALLSAQPVARLATIGPGGQPHLVPVCFVLLDEPSGPVIAIPIDQKPKRTTSLARLRNLRRDPRATLLVDHYEDDWTQLAWVRLDLHGTVIPTAREWPSALVALRTRYPQYRTMQLEDLPLLRFTIDRIVSWFARR
ncbi:MAG: TIGR03668 family PPOX class F420-dependent oxidoreductase [Chloroflexota bacterium]